MAKFKRAFIANPVVKFDDAKLAEVADEVIAVCPTPMFDWVVEDEAVSSAYRQKIAKSLDDFNPETDVVLDHGDPLTFALMIYYLADCEFMVGRYNRRVDGYVFYNIYAWWIDEDADEENGDDERKSNVASRH